MLGKAGRSKSTPHLQQNPEGKKKLSSQLSASDNKLKETKSGFSQKAGRRDLVEPSRPIPKPRISIKTKLKDRKNQGRMF